jgi:RNA polymerase sigma factor (sigma-70 family)
MKALKKPRGGETATDAALLARVAAGEVSALGALYDRHAPSMLRFAQRIDPQEYEDLIQATFLRVAQLASRFDGRTASARAWVFAIMTRVAQERSRSLRRWTAALNRFADVPRRGAIAPNDTASDLDRALNRLSVAKRSVIVLSEIEGFTCEEIAVMLRIPIGTVWTRLHHARKELRALHDDDSEHGEHES